MVSKTRRINARLDQCDLEGIEGKAALYEISRSRLIHDAVRAYERTYGWPLGDDGLVAVNYVAWTRADLALTRLLEETREISLKLAHIEGRLDRHFDDGVMGEEWHESLCELCVGADRKLASVVKSAERVGRTCAWLRAACSSRTPT